MKINVWAFGSFGGNILIGFLLLMPQM